MATLAQLLDKPAPPLNYGSSSSSSSSCNKGPLLSLGQDITITKIDPPAEDYDEDREIDYRRPLSKKKTGTMIGDKEILSSSSSNSNNSRSSSSSPNVRTKGSNNKSQQKQSQSPGSRLSLIATSLPHPKVSKSSGSLSPSGQNFNSKPLPGLSPICGSALAMKQRRRRVSKDVIPLIVNIKPVKGRKGGRKGKRDLVVDGGELRSANSGNVDDHCEDQEGHGGDEDDEGVSKREKQAKNRIKRPLNAFMVWSKLHRRKIMDQDPTVHHSLISKQLGAGWKSLSSAERLPYYQEAKRLSELHSQIYPDYKYQPRKRSKGSPFPQLGFENRHSNSGDLSAPAKGEDSLLNLCHYNNIKNNSNDDSFIHRSLDGSLDLSMKRSLPPQGITKDSKQSVSSPADTDLRRRNSCFSSTTTYSESASDSADSSLELIPQPLNMSLKSNGSSSGVGEGKSVWSRVYHDESETDEDRLVIDE